jgi:hypothetical protein
MKKPLFFFIARRGRKEGGWSEKRLKVGCAAGQTEKLPNHIGTQ